MNVPTDKDAILIVAFGTATEKGLDVYRQLEDDIHESYPSSPLMWAFTSDSALNSDQDHPKAYSLSEAIQQLDGMGMARLIVLPLYVVPGMEYEKLETELEKTFASPLSSLKEYVLAAPLLHEARDADMVSQALLESLPDDEEDSPERVLFMGHGSLTEAGSAAYTDVDDLLDRTYPGARLGLLKGDSFETLLAEWGDADDDEEVLLRPFFFTIGTHSQENMAGDSPDSWKRRLEKLGYKCRVEFISLGELPLVRQLLLDHIEEAFEELLQRS